MYYCHSSKNPGYTSIEVVVKNILVKIKNPFTLQHLVCGSQHGDAIYKGCNFSEWLNHQCYNVRITTE
jgi:hypothetical protein